VTGPLKPSQEQNRYQIADRERVVRRVEATVDLARLLAQVTAQPFGVRLLMYLATLGELLEKVHGAKLLSMPTRPTAHPTSEYTPGTGRGRKNQRDRRLSLQSCGAGFMNSRLGLD
jgi:hypothetical protein